MSRIPIREIEDYEYEDDDYEYDGKRRTHRLHRDKKESVADKKKRWDRETLYDHDHDYDERR